MLEHIGADIADATTIVCPTPPPPHSGRLKNLDAIADVALATASAAEAAARRGDVVLALGGDHSSAIGSIAGASRAHKSIGVIYIDAHPDVNTAETTLTGNVHGMVAALALGHGDRELINPRPIKPAHFLHIGIKDFDQSEIEFLRREEPTYHTMLDIVHHGLGPVFGSIDTLAQKVDTVWVSMDMDSIDRTAAPGVAMQNEHGLTLREILSLAQYIGHATPIAGLDIVEILPSNDKESKTAKLAIELTARFLGSQYGGYNDYIARYEEAGRMSTVL